MLCHLHELQTLAFGSASSPTDLAEPREEWQKWMWSSQVLLSCLQNPGPSGSVCMIILWCLQRVASGHDAASTLLQFTEGHYDTCHLVMVDNGNHWIMGVFSYEQYLWTYLLNKCNIPGGLKTSGTVTSIDKTVIFSFYVLEFSVTLSCCDGGGRFLPTCL